MNSSSATRSRLCLCLLLVIVAGCGNRGDLYLLPNDVDRLLENDVRGIGDNVDGLPNEGQQEVDPSDDPDDEKDRRTRDTSPSNAENVDAITDPGNNEIPVQ